MGNSTVTIEDFVKNYNKAFVTRSQHVVTVATIPKSPDTKDSSQTYNSPANTYRIRTKQLK